MPRAGRAGAAAEPAVEPAVGRVGSCGFERGKARAHVRADPDVSDRVALVDGDCMRNRRANPNDERPVVHTSREPGRLSEPGQLAQLEL